MYNKSIAVNDIPLYTAKRQHVEKGSACDDRLFSLPAVAISLKRLKKKKKTLNIMLYLHVLFALFAILCI